jgi:cardiolipin synthase
MKDETTSWTLYASNEEALNAMLADCAQATTSIVLEQFIFTRDEFSTKLIDVCEARAAAGVDVRFLWDAAGSFSFFGSDIVQELRTKGVKLLFWKTLIPSYFSAPNYRSWYLRNHRRTAVIDNRIGYTGSICLSDRMKNWRDTNVRMVGPIVADMQHAFDRMWSRARGKHLPMPPATPRDREFRYLTNHPAPNGRRLYAALVEAVRSAQKYVYIVTPYFVPTHRLFRVLRLAGHRGVDVRIVIPERSDHFPALDIAARSYFKTLFKSGVRIFLYPNSEGNIIHSKAVVVDGEWATVGSLNLDSASLLYNYEANIVTTNTKFAEELASHFVHDMNDSVEVNPEEWSRRFFIEKIPETLIKLVRKFL